MNFVIYLVLLVGIICCCCSAWGFNNTPPWLRPAGWFLILVAVAIYGFVLFGLIHPAS